MSDPVTNAQVEDVLSSIRRLVGNNKRPDVAVAKAPEADRLVLTPQLRVQDTSVLRLEPEDVVADGESSAAPRELLVKNTEEFSIAPGVDEFTYADLMSPSSEKFGDETETAEEEENDAPDFRTSRPTSSSDLSAKIAALETAIARTSDQWEPDADDEDDYAGSRSPSLRWQEDVDLDARGTPLTIKPLAPAESTVEVDGSEIIDEEALRDLVGDIVREELSSDLVAQIVRAELQGDLGARITRNVRKLVRREIQRAMTARELD